LRKLTNIAVHASAQIYFVSLMISASAFWRKWPHITHRNTIINAMVAKWNIQAEKITSAGDLKHLFHFDHLCNNHKPRQKLRYFFTQVVTVCPSDTYTN